MSIANLFQPNNLNLFVGSVSTKGYIVGDGIDFNAELTPGATSIIGTNPTLLISGSQLGGIVSVFTGTGISGSSGIILTVTLPTNEAFTGSIFGIVISPANLAAASVSTSVYANSIAPGVFTITTQTMLSNSNTYVWNWIIAPALV